MKKAISVLLTLVVFIAAAPRVHAESPDIYVSAKSAILINAETGTVLFEKNAHERRAIASTTKLLTALITAESGELDREFTVDSMAIRVEGTSMGLVEGDIVTKRALIYGMLLPSGNDAANAAAVSISGSVADFTELMNLYAKSLGMNESNFVTPSGLDADGHYSSAFDMAILARAAMRNELVAEVCGLANAQVSYGNPPYMRWLSNNNKLLWNYEGCTGMKTGFTDNARRCLVSSATRDGVKLICITLNAPDDWNDHTALLDYGFSVVQNTALAVSAPAVCIVGGNVNAVALVPAEPLEMPLTADESARIKTEIYTQPFLYADTRQGTVAGKIEVYLDDERLKTVDLLTTKSVVKEAERLGFWEGIWQFIVQFFTA